MEQLGWLVSVHHENSSEFYCMSFLYCPTEQHWKIFSRQRKIHPTTMWGLRGKKGREYGGRRVKAVTGLSSVHMFLTRDSWEMIKIIWSCGVDLQTEKIRGRTFSASAFWVIKSYLFALVTSQQLLWGFPLLIAAPSVLLRIAECLGVVPVTMAVLQLHVSL